MIGIRIFTARDGDEMFPAMSRPTSFSSYVPGPKPRGTRAETPYQLRDADVLLVRPRTTPTEPT